MTPVDTSDRASNSTSEHSWLARDPLPAVLIGLTVTTGLVDAISVLGLGGVFTANMTGNVVFLGFAIAGVPGFSIPRSLTALMFFLAGAVGGGWLGMSLGGGTRRRWLLVVAGVETALLLVSCLIALGYDPATHEPPVRLYALIALTALAMGTRNATVRQLGVADMTTTVLTLALTGLAADSALAGGANTRWGRRVASVLAILIGAAGGALLVTTVGLVAPLILTAGLTLVLTIAYAAHPASTAAARGPR